MKKRYLKDRKLYNEDLKKRYLDFLDSKTAQVVNYIFYKSSDLERQYDKDLSSFTIKEFESLIVILNRKTLQSLTTTVSMIKSYIDFAIKEGYVNSLLNVAERFSRSELRRYVNQITSNKRYIEKEKFDDMVSMFVNAQDQAIYMLLWEGVKGERYSELSNLRKRDVDFNNETLTLFRDDGFTRRIKVAHKTINIIENAIKEEKYIKNNGEIYDNMRSAEGILATTEYVLRPSGKDKDGKMKSQSINNRFKKMCEWYGNPYLTPTSLHTSGLINFAKNLKDEKGELVDEDYQMIHSRYGFNPNTWYQTKMKIDEEL